MYKRQVRGTPESRATVTKAVDLALEFGARLTFLHIVDAEFLQHATVGPLSVVYHELKEMSTFTMMILCERAQRRGVEQVDFIIKEGNVRKQLMKTAIESKVDFLIIGEPSGRRRRNEFSGKEFSGFVADLEQETGLKIILVKPEENQ